MLSRGRPIGLRAVVVDCRFVGAEVYTLELLPEASLSSVLDGITGLQTSYSLRGAVNDGVVGVTVNSLDIPVTGSLPPDADVITLKEGSGGHRSASHSPRSVDTTLPFEVVLSRRPSTPPVPVAPAVVANRWKRRDATSTAKLAADTAHTRATLEDPNARRCTIFDPLRQVEVAYSPVCGEPFRFLNWALSRAQHLGSRPDGRVLIHEFDSFPGPQICIHPPIRGDFVALPVEVSPGIVCTIVAPRDFSALQLMIQLEQDCSVTRMQRLLLTHGRIKLKVNGMPIDDPFQRDALIVADSASVTPHYVLLEHGVAPDAELLTPHWRNAVGPMVVHRPQRAPLELHLPASLSPSGVRNSLISIGVIDNAGSIHMPHVCPVIPGVGLHLLAVDRLSVETETTFCIVDLRRAVHPPIVPFWVTPVACQADFDYMVELLHDEFPSLGPVLEIFYDQRPLHTAFEHSGAPWLTVMAFPRVTSSRVPVLEPALTHTGELSRLRPGYRAIFAQFRRYHSTTRATTCAPSLGHVPTTESTTFMQPAGMSSAGELGSTGDHIFGPVRLVFSLPGMVPRARAWHPGRNIAQVLWPLVAPFAPHLPQEPHLRFVACSRVYRGNDGTFEILLTIEHPDFFCHSIWVRDSADRISLRLTSVSPGMTVTEIVASTFPQRKFANTLLDGVRSDDHPVCRNGMIISVCDDWRTDQSFPLADWQFTLCGCGILPFAPEVPTMLHSLPPACLDVSHPLHEQTEATCHRQFMSLFLGACASLVRWHCESVTDKHIRVVLPGRGMCRVKWMHCIAPSAEALRPVIEELWPEFSLSAILDTHSFQQDACIYLVQGTSRLYTAWIQLDRHNAATDIRLVPCGFHPVSCIPAQPGMHTAILQSHGAWGLFRYEWGTAPSVPRTPHHSATIAAWEAADHDSVDEAFWDSPDPSEHPPEIELIPGPAIALHSPAPLPDAAVASNYSSSSVPSSSSTSLHLLQKDAILIRPKTVDSSCEMSDDQSVETTPPSAAAQSGSRAPAPVLSHLPCSLSLPTPCRSRRQPVSVDLMRSPSTVEAPACCSESQRTATPTNVATVELESSTKPTLRLEELLPTKQSQGVLDIGVVSHMLVDLGEDYHLKALQRNWSLVKPLPRKVASLIASFPCGSPDTVPDAFQIFVDGSFQPDPPTSAWALCVFGLVGLHWHWLGFLSDRIPTSLATGPTGKQCAHVAEQWAVLHALAFAVTHGKPTFIGFDNTAAAGQAQGQFSSHPLSKLQCASISLLRTCSYLHTPIHFHHIKSHRGHSGNEFVDAAAKAACRTDGFKAPPHNHYLAELFDLGDLDWLWCPFAQGPSLPPVDSAGMLIEHSRPSPGAAFTPLDFLPVSQQPQAAEPLKHWSARFCTYNTLSLRALAQRECLDEQFHRARIHVVCLQETRQPACSRFHHRFYFGASSGDDHGQFGCQVWFNSSLRLSEGTRSPVIWRPETLSVLHSEPRALLVTCMAGQQTFAILSAHAPTAASDEDALRTWWTGLLSIARKSPHNALLFCGIDANARFNASATHISEAAAEGVPGTLLCQFATAQQLTSSGLVDSDAHPIATWTSPNGKPACLDYILFPGEMEHNVVTRGRIPGFADMFPKDHAPLTADATWTLVSHVRPKRVHFDTDAMRTETGRAQLLRIHQSTPAVPWHIDVDTHACILTRHLQAQLALHFPSSTCKPRQATITDATWAHIRMKRHSKRVGRRAAELLRKEILQAFFGSWRHRSRSGSSIRQQHLRFLIAQCQRLCMCATSSYRARIRRDCANKARSLFFEAKGKGPEALAHHMRSLIRTGRRYKPLPTQPCLIDDGRAAQDPLLELGLHFAADEHGYLCEDSAEFSSRPVGQSLSSSQPFSRLDVISLPQLTVAFAALNSHKAAGLTGIPPEAFSHAAIEAAAVYWPLYLKTTVRQQAPIIWRGGRVVPINKPQKALGTRAAWRSILLMEASAKAVCSAARPALLHAFEKVVRAAQGGSRRGSALQLPMAYAHVTLDFLVRTGKSGGLIFFDGKAAFYATFRETVLGHDSLLTGAQLEVLATKVSDDPNVQDAFLTGALGPGLLEHAGVPVGLRHYIACSLRQTWFLIGDQNLFITRTGTMPGAPLADIIFQFAFAQFLEKAHSHLQSLGLLMSVQHGTPESPCVPSPTWMDDIAVPLEAPTASQLVPRAQQIVNVVATQLAKIGIQVNTGTGKSEALLHFAGHGSRKIRHYWLIQRSALFPVQLAGGISSEMQIVSHYVHLGTTISFDRAPQLDIKKRAAAARDARRRIHRPLLTNPHLTADERLSMHWSLVIRKFLHGAGIWAFRLDRDFHCFSSAYLSLVRPICLPILGLSAKGLDDDTVCAICGFPSARQLRDIELLSIASSVGSRACEALSFMLSDSAWLAEVATAWKRLCQPDCSLTPHQLLQQWQASPSATQATISATRRQCRLACKAARAPALAAANSQLARAFDGWVTFEVADTHGCTSFQCHICGHHCASASGLAVHQLHSHSIASTAGITGSATLCPACGTEFWEQHRLRDHLRKNRACLVPIVESDVDFAGRSKTTHHQRAWRPAVRVPFVQPFWATLRPLTTRARPNAATAISSGVLASLEAISSSLSKWQSPKDSLITLVARVRGAVSSTKCASSDLATPDHPLFSFVELATWLCYSVDDLGVFDGVGFRAARLRGRVLVQFTESTVPDCTDSTLTALARMLA